MNVREATPADVPALDVVRRQAVEAGFSGASDRSAFADEVATPDDRLETWVRDASWVVLVGESDVTPVGYGALDAETGELGALYTAPEHEGRGCATRLLERFEARARAADLDRLHAAVPGPAVGFFERRGFDRLEAVTDEGGIDRVRVARPVGQR